MEEYKRALEFFFVESLTKQVCQHVIGMNPASVGDPNKEPEIVAKEAIKPIVEEPRGK